MVYPDFHSLLELESNSPTVVHFSGGVSKWLWTTRVHHPGQGAHHGEYWEQMTLMTWGSEDTN